MESLACSFFFYPLGFLSHIGFFLKKGSGPLNVLQAFPPRRQSLLDACQGGPDGVHYISSHSQRKTICPDSATCQLWAHITAPGTGLVDRAMAASIAQNDITAPHSSAGETEDGNGLNAAFPSPSCSDLQGKLIGLLFPAGSVLS